MIRLHLRRAIYGFMYESINSGINKEGVFKYDLPANEEQPDQLKIKEYNIKEVCLLNFNKDNY